MIVHINSFNSMALAYEKYIFIIFLYYFLGSYTLRKV